MQIIEKQTVKKYSNKINNVIGWGISREKLHTKLFDKTYKLQTLDIDFGTKCSLHCPHCFKNKFNHAEINGNVLTFDEIKEIILQAKELGLESIKILGAGEPLENEEFLDFIKFNSSLDIHTCVFTKGHVLGNDNLAKKYNQNYGITTARDLAKELYSLKTSILLGFNSFEKDKQLAFCGVPNSTNFNYFECRNNALILLIEAGFNKFNENEATRLALICAPYKLSNIDEVFDIYKFGKKQNIYVAICPSTVSGMGHSEQEKIKQCKGEFYQKSIDVYTQIYVWAIKNQYISKEDFIQDGVSLYPGAHVCNQVAAGLYIIWDGKVMICPGLDGADAIVYDDVRKKSLKEIWKNSPNYERAGMTEKFNFQCVAREKALFNNDNFYSIVYKKVLSKI
jgi:MoaA/NifB/PqqE/SkfB family radical SAM enzyme